MSRSLHRAPDVLAAPLDDTMLLLNVTTGRYHGLDPIAGRIWDLLAEPIDEEELIARLVSEFEVTEEQCRGDVGRFLDGLAARGLLASA